MDWYLVKFFLPFPLDLGNLAKSNRHTNKQSIYVDITKYEPETETLKIVNMPPLPDEGITW